MISFIETTGANVEKDAKWAWSKFRNAEISQKNSKIPAIHSPLEWNSGFCFECGYTVSKTATGCPNCHISFCE